MTKHKTMKRSKTFWGSLLGLTVLCLAILVYIFIFSQNTSANEYPIKGFDISHHQGEVQWKKISAQNYQFVYLKATEGGDFQDKKFADNWLQARENGFHVGAYHFYRLCRDGAIQAKNFIATVPKKADALPPVIDLEYDSNCINTLTKEQLLKEIQIMHDKLYQHYEKQPIFYISKSFYNIVLAGQFPNTPLWVREYQGKPELKNNPPWLLWQQTNQGKITGISKVVDLNVFNGDEKKWAEFLKKNNIH